MPDVKLHIHNINQAIDESIVTGLKAASQQHESYRFAALGGAVDKTLRQLKLADASLFEAFAALVRENPPTGEDVATTPLKPLDVFGALAETSKTSNLIGLKSARHLELDDNLYLGIIDEDVFVTDRAAAIYTMVSSMATAPVSEEYTVGAGSEWKASAINRILELISADDFGPAQMAQVGTLAYLMLLNHGKGLRTEDGGSFDASSLIKTLGLVSGGVDVSATSRKLGKKS